MRNKILMFILALSCVLIAGNDEKPKVYLDCSNCDYDFIRTEITFINYVIERQTADIFIMIKTQTTGGSGQKYSVEFIGKNRFENKNDTLKFNTKNDDTDDVIRRKIVSILKMGLMQYISKTELSGNIDISYNEESAEQELKDRWDSWVFSIGGNGYFNGSKTRDYRNMYGYADIKRITEEWIFKMSYFASQDYVDDRAYGYKDISESQSSDLSIVKSLSDHWSAGIVTGWSTSEYSNRENYVFFYPRIEYNIFPYSESNTRMLRIMYGIGGNYAKYFETTIYDENEEILSKQSLEIALSVKKEWGSIHSSVTGSNFLHDFEKKRLDSYAQISLNVFKGLSLNINGGYSMIHDQLSLPKGDYTEEDVLLQKKELETSFSYWSSVGFSYTFGSIFNNVVNPRFGN